MAQTGSSCPPGFCPAAHITGTFIRLEPTEAVEKRVSYDVGDTRPGPSRLPLIDRRLRLERGDQVLIAAISGPTPMIAITRFRL
jgi:hypothetical protein